MPASASYRSDVVDAALTCAATLCGMEVVFVSSIDDADTFTFERIRGVWPTLTEGYSAHVSDSFCHRMLAGAPNSTSRAAADPHYADAPIRDALKICSYVGVPILAPGGAVVGTLCGIDRGEVPVDDTVIHVLEQLALIVAAHLLGGGQGSGVTIRRTAAGWVVGDESDAPCLTSAMVLADLLADDLRPPQRPPRPPAEVSELDRLQLAVVQLEHALAARVTVEQAIGVLVERLGVRPRDAFEVLRKVARRRAIRVHDLSRDVVESAVDAGVTLPAELAR